MSAWIVDDIPVIGHAYYANLIVVVLLLDLVALGVCAGACLWLLLGSTEAVGFLELEPVSILDHDSRQGSDVDFAGGGRYGLELEVAQGLERG